MEALDEKRRQEHEDTNKLLDQLHSSVMRTKDTAGRMGETLDEHHQMLGHLDNRVGEVHGEVSRQNRSVLQILQTSKHKGFFAACAILLLIMIILISI